ncbi:MAG: hypothetical protein HY744_21090 [Deltaproteobacteria bacterium]|nr:hypothetical protein [Deltaproteobacteria bacterium]
MDDYEPFCIGSRLRIAAPGAPAAPGGRIDIVLARGAGGSGEHETTASLCYVKESCFQGSGFCAFAGWWGMCDGPPTFEEPDVRVRYPTPAGCHMDLSIAHEWGHEYFCAGEEYGDSGRLCGHSIMADDYAHGQYNMCYFHTQGSLEDHEKDKTCGAADSGLDSAWDQANNAGVTPWKPSETPDNYSYAMFDFNNQVGTVVIH